MGQPGEVICRRDRLCDYAPDRGAVAGPTLGDLAGENASGPWKLCIGDSRPGSPGTLDRVELTITPGGRDGIECGNHKVEYGEQCEDGNTLSGDGCNGQCRLETFVLTVSPSSQIVGAGEGASYQLDVASVGGFAEEVELSVTSNPRLAATIAFSANPVRAPGTATLALETTPATAPGTYDLTLTAASGGTGRAQKVSVHVVSAVIPSSDTPIDIPDNDRAGITSTIVVLAPLEVHTIAVELDITHTFIGNLLVTLTSPRGTEVTVHDQTGDSADDIQQIYLFPDRFRGESADGEWTLSVSDRFGTDVGTLDHWALGIMSVP